MEQDCVLAVGAHPDDLELGCGATLASIAKKSFNVNGLIITDGSFTLESTPPRNPIVRKAESLASAQILGMTVHFGGLRDRHSSAIEMANVLDEFCQRLRPAIVLCHRRTHDHPDHDAAAEAAAAVCGRRSLRLVHYEIPLSRYTETDSLPPDLLVDVTGTWDLKVQAASQHQSEIARGSVDMQEVEGRAEYWAAIASSAEKTVRFAEAFWSSKQDDAVTYLTTLITSH